MVDAIDIVPDPANAAAQSPEDREMLAKLMAQIATGQHPQYTPENLWALQGPWQFPEPRRNPEIRDFAAEVGPGGDRTPTRMMQETPTGPTKFPVAPAGPMSPGNAIETLNKQPEMPFPGAKKIDVKPYDLPPSKKKARR